jgi:hypothetical protein
MMYAFSLLSRYVELIGGEIANTYLQTFIVQSNHGSRGLNHIVKSRCACVWNIWYVVDKW